MKNFINGFLAFVLMSLAVACGGVQRHTSAGITAETAVPIVIQRTPISGQRYRVVVHRETNSRTVMTTSGEMGYVREQRLVTDMTAIQTIVAVDETGDVTEAEYAIESFTVERDLAGVTEPVARGEVIRVTPAASSDNATIVFQSGLVVTPQLRHLLRQVLDLVNVPGSRDDRYGTETPQRIGAHWPVNVDANVRDAASTGLVLDPQHVSGTTTLINVVDCETGSCLELRGEVVATGFAPSPMPDGATVLESEMNKTFEGLFPRDSTILEPTITSTTSTSFIFQQQTNNLLARVRETVSTVETRTHTRL